MAENTDHRKSGRLPTYKAVLDLAHAVQRSFRDAQSALIYRLQGGLNTHKKSPATPAADFFKPSGIGVRFPLDEIFGATRPGKPSDIRSEGPNAE
jgi:hypothetical protein